MANSCMMECLDRTVEYVANWCRRPFFWQWSMQSHEIGAKDLSKSHWIGARDLSIPHSENPKYWTWSTIPNTSIEVVTVKYVNWFDIRGKVDTARLLPKVNYGVYFVFKLKKYPKNLEYVTARVKFCKDITDGTHNEGRTIFIDKKKGYGETGIFPYQLSDGWMEVGLGSFFNNLGEDGLVDVRLHETDDYRVKQGLIVKGIDIRPLGLLRRRDYRTINDF